MCVWGWEGINLGREMSEGKRKRERVELLSVWLGCVTWRETG